MSDRSKIISSAIVSSAAHHIVDLLGEPEKKVEIRPLTIGDYKILVKSLEGLDLSQMTEEEKISALIQVDRAFDMVLRSCVINPPDFDPGDLFSSDWMYLFSVLKSVSKGNLIELKVKCPKCSEKINFQIDLNDLEKTKKEKNEYKCKISDEITLFLNPPRRKDDYEIAEYSKNDVDKGDLLFLKLASTIDKIIFNGKEIIDLTLDEKMEIFDAFSYEQKKKAHEEYSSMDFGINLSVSYKCKTEGCDHVVEERAVDLFDFFTI